MATATATDREIVVEDIGPVERVVIPIPGAGGVVELRGANGAGKSTTLAAVAAAVTGEGQRSLSVRRGANRGTVEGFGVTLRLSAKSSRRTGQLEVESIETRFDLDQLVDPKIKDEVSADARRLKAVIGLVELPPPVVKNKLAALLPSRDEFDAIVPATELDAADGDILVMAERTKRRLDARALELERSGETKLNEAGVLADRVKGVDIVAPSDSAELQQELEMAIRRHSALKEQAEAAAKASRVEQQARQLLAEYEGDTSAVTVSQAEKAEALASAEWEAANEEVRKATEILALAEKAAAVAKQKTAAAREAIQDAKRRERMIQQWRGQINQASVVPPEPEQLDAAEAEVTVRRQALEMGATIRQAQADHRAATDARTKAKELLAKANVLREAAKSIDGVLSDIVREAGLDVTVRADRIYYGDRLFAELSHGERWRAVLELAAKRSGPGEIFHVPQEAWEGLQPKHKRAVAAKARELGIVILTARASDDERIVAEVL